MPNLLTQYTNGTFEDIKENWQGDFPVFWILSADRSSEQAYQGTYSAKLITKAINNSNTYAGWAAAVHFKFPAVLNTAYEFTLRLYVDNSFPDDVIFFLDAMANSEVANPGYMYPIRASVAKGVWIELKTNFVAKVDADGNTLVDLTIIFDSDRLQDNLSASSEALQQWYGQVLTFSTTTSIPLNAIFYIDAAYVDVAVVPTNVSPQFAGRKLYYDKHAFYLVVNNQEIQIREPIKWDDVNIEIIFDRKTKMYRFEFSDKDVLLEFSNKSGRNILMEQNELHGTNANVLLRFKKINVITGDSEVLYEGTINFAEGYSEQWDRVKANVEKRSFNEKLRTNWDVRTDIFSTMSLGGMNVDPIVTNELYLHPRLLSFKSELKYNENVDAAQTLEVLIIPGAGDDPQFNYSVPPLKIISNNVEGITEPYPPEGTLKYAGFTLPAGISKLRYYFQWRTSFKFTMGNTSQFISAGMAIYKVPNISLGNTGDLWPSIFTDPGVLIDYDEYGNSAGIKYFSGYISGFLDLYADEAIFIKVFVFTPGNTQFDISDFEFTATGSHSLTINEQTVYRPTVVNAPRLHELVNRQLELILDVPNPLKSDFLGRIDLGYDADGCPCNHLMMDGKMIRKFTKPCNISAKDWYIGLDGIFNMALSIERDNNDVQSVRFEPIEYFFRNVLLMKLDVISDYSRSPDDEQLFNEIIGGFKKYPQNNQQDSLEDFHTKMEYVTPLDKIKNKLSIDIPFILSGNYIEYTRREAFSENPTNAYETDDDIFMVDAMPAEAFTDVNIIFDQSNNEIIITGLFPAVAGDQFTISEATGAVTNGTYTAISVDVPFTYNQVIIKVASGSLPTDGAGTGNVVLTSTGRFRAKRDDDFETITGVSFPKSVYNMAHHIKRIILRHAKVFQSGWSMFVKQNLSKHIKFVAGANNIQVLTELKDSVTCRYGDNPKRERIDNGYENIQNIDKPIFDKDVVTFNAPLTWTAMKYVTAAYEGRNEDGRNYGFFMWTNPFGKIERGYGLHLKFNPTSQICKFTIRKKYDG